MKSYPAILGAVVLSAVFTMPSILHGQQPPAAPNHEQHDHGSATDPGPTATGRQADMSKMMAGMAANDRKLDALVKKMSAAQGAAKVDAMAELLTTLVQDHRMMGERMMMMKMNMMGQMHGRGDGSTPPEK